MQICTGAKDYIASEQKEGGESMWWGMVMVSGQGGKEVAESASFSDIVNHFKRMTPPAILLKAVHYTGGKTDSAISFPTCLLTTTIPPAPLSVLLQDVDSVDIM